MGSRLRFGCVEELAELLGRAGLPLELTQLSNGALRGELVPLSIGPLQILRVHVHGALHASGGKPRGRQLVCLDLAARPRDGLLCAHGHRLPGQALFGLRPHSEVHVTIADRCDLAILSIEQNRFHSWAESLGGPDLDPGVFKANWVGIDPLRFNSVGGALRRLLALAALDPQGLQHGSGGARLAAEDLVPQIVEALAHATGRHGGLVRPPARIELVKLAQRWMAEHPGEPISLDALCRQVYSGRRTLIQGFREHLGMGPMAYLKLQRLHAVRRLLRSADPAQTSVTEVAARFGFLNPGHFACDYRRRFGELPSTTLSGRGRSL